ncbi:unnamed protein product [Alopecurus aequalis]
MGSRVDLGAGFPSSSEDSSTSINSVLRISSAAQTEADATAQRWRGLVPLVGVEAARGEAPLVPVDLEVEAAAEPAWQPPAWKRKGSPGTSKHQGPLPAQIPKKHLPKQMHGVCYNCGDPEHIRAYCTNKSRCFVCGIEGHRSKDCTSKRPRSPSDSSNGGDDRGRLPVRQRIGAGGGGVGQLPLPPPVGPGGARVPARQRIGEGATGIGAEGVKFMAGQAGSGDGVGPSRSWSAIARGVEGTPRLSVPFSSSERTEVVPATQPLWPGKICVVDPSPEMRRLEEELDLSLLASTGGDGPTPTVMRAGEAIRAHFNLSQADVSLVRHRPADFLLIFGFAAARKRVLDAGYMRRTNMLLFFRPWSRLEGASGRTMLSKVEVEMIGIPSHDWEMRSAEVLLQDSGWVDDVDFVTVSRSDMSRFRFTAWTPNPAMIPPANTLAVTEPDVEGRLKPPERGLRFRQKLDALLYPVQIKVREIEPSPPPSPGRSPDDHRWNDGDSGHNGHPSDWEADDVDEVLPPPPPPPPRGPILNKGRYGRGGGGGTRRPASASVGQPSSAACVRPVLAPVAVAVSAQTPQSSRRPALASVVERPAAVSVSAPQSSGRPTGTSVGHDVAAMCTPAPHSGRVLPVAAGSSPGRWDPRASVSLPRHVVTVPGHPTSGVEPAMPLAGPASPQSLEARRDGTCELVGGIQTSPCLWVTPGVVCAQGKVVGQASMVSPLPHTSSEFSVESDERVDFRGRPVNRWDSSGGSSSSDVDHSCQVLARTVVDQCSPLAGVGLCMPPTVGSPAFVDRLDSCEEERWACMASHACVLQAPAVAASPQEQVRSFVEMMAGTPRTPILSAGTVLRRRNLKVVPPSFKPRRSARLAKDKRPGSTAPQKAQGNLMRKMGLVADDAVVSDEDLKYYVEAFNKPLSSSEIRALAMLFNITVEEGQP